MSRAVKTVQAHEQALLRSSLRALKGVEALLPAVRGCIENGGFPIYLDDMINHAAVLGQLASAFHALRNARQDMERAAPKRRKKRAARR